MNILLRMHYDIVWEYEYWLTKINIKYMLEVIKKFASQTEKNVEQWQTKSKQENYRR